MSEESFRPRAIFICLYGACKGAFVINTLSMEQ